MTNERVDIVILTHNRKREVLRTIARMTAVDNVGAVIVVDNDSADGTADAVAAEFPHVRIIRLARNVGAAARNAGVREARAAYVAFCDDDTWWTRDSLRRASALLDAYPRLGVITARVLVGPQQREDPTNADMAQSPFPNELGINGTEVFGFLAGACVMRRRAFVQTGGYDPRFFIGGEEALLAIDLMAAGWRMAYVPDIVVHHHPSTSRDARIRRRLLIRNALWCAWLRRPLLGAIGETAMRLRRADNVGDAIWSAAAALRGLTWIRRARRVVPAHVEKALRVRDAFDARVQSDVTNASALIQSSTKRPIAKRASA